MNPRGSSSGQSHISRVKVDIYGLFDADACPLDHDFLRWRTILRICGDRRLGERGGSEGRESEGRRREPNERYRYPGKAHPGPTRHSSSLRQRNSR